MVKKILPFLVLAVVVFGLAAVLPASTGFKNAQAADNELTGFAWSSNIGWVSLNCSNTGSCVTSNYKVTKRADGLLAGYGWSSNIGWVGFAPASRNYPVGRGTFAGSARFDGNNIKGWIQALANGGGWDGWISMAGQTTAGGNYGPTYIESTKKFSGFAWGGDVVGWVDFQYANCPTCGGGTSEIAGLNVALSGDGSGTVTSDDGKINCGSDCSENYPTNRKVTLTAVSAEGDTFEGWTGDCATKTGNQCEVNVVVREQKAVTASFDSDGGGECDPATEDCCNPDVEDCDDGGGNDKTLRVAVSGPGGVTGVGISCGTAGSDCSESYRRGTEVTLVATAANFTGWGGDVPTACNTTTLSCVVVLTSDKNVTASFGVIGSNLFSLACQSSGSVCTIKFNCDSVTNCASKDLYSEWSARITANYDGVTYTVLPDGLPNDDQGTFEVRFCSNPDSLSNCDTNLGGFTKDTPRYLRFFKPAGKNPRSNVYYIDFKAEAGPTALTKRINLDFTNSAGTQ